MKKSDIAMIILIASVSAMLAFFVASQIPGLKQSEAGVKVPVAEELSEEVIPPEMTIFNDQAINPTVETVIGNGQGMFN